MNLEIAMFGFLKCTVAVLIGALMLVVAFDYAMSMPDVFVSYATKECQSVINYEGFFFGKELYSCENLPEKFNHIWTN
jgi:hypothetical protein